MCDELYEPVFPGPTFALKKELEQRRPNFRGEETFGKPGQPLIDTMVVAIVCAAFILPYRGVRLLVKRAAQAAGVAETIGFSKKSPPKTC